MSLRDRREYMKKRREQFIKQGKCVKCRKKNTSKTTLICPKCKMIRQRENREYYLKRKERMKKRESSHHH